MPRHDALRLGHDDLAASRQTGAIDLFEVDERPLDQDVVIETARDSDRLFDRVPVPTDRDAYRAALSARLYAQRQTESGDRVVGDLVVGHRDGIAPPLRRAQPERVEKPL